MKKLGITILVMLLLALNCTSTQAKYSYKSVEPECFEEPVKIRATCYCEHGITASGQQTRYGIAAGKKEWLGMVCEINQVNEDGSVGPLIGYFEFADTGAGMDSDGDGKGDTIRDGKSIDIWVDNLWEAYNWVGTYGDYVYIKIFRGEG